MAVVSAGPFFCDCVLRPFGIFLPLKFALPLCVPRREERCRQVGPVWLKYNPNAAFQKTWTFQSPYTRKNTMEHQLKLESVLREGAAVWRHSTDVMNNGFYYLVSFLPPLFCCFSCKAAALLRVHSRAHLPETHHFVTVSHVFLAAFVSCVTGAPGGQRSAISTSTGTQHESCFVSLR